MADDMPENVVDIVADWLNANGCDGLVDDYGECACCLYVNFGDCPNMGYCRPAYYIEACRGCTEDCEWVDSLLTFKGYVPDCERTRKESAE